MKLVVVGGGIAGLAAAHRVTELRPDADVTVLEAGARPGGQLRTERTSDGFVIERGPDSILADKPAAVALAERVGLEDKIVSTNTQHRGAYVLNRGRLERLPEGFSLLAPTTPGPFLRTPILSMRGKLRAGLDLMLPRGDDGRDESLSSFVQRRLGREVLDRLAQPLVGGIYGADPGRLSLQATMPRFVEAERAHRSVSLGLRRAARGKQNKREYGARYGLFVSFADGIQTLPDAVAARLGERVRCGVRVSSLARDTSGYRVVTEGGGEMEADAVIVAVPASRAAALVEPVDRELGDRLRAIRYGSAATVTFAWKRDEIPHALDAFGFVVPRVERRPLLASTWASIKWPNRAPHGHVLIRAFLGGADYEEIVTYGNDELEAVGRHELRDVLGVAAEPSLVRIDRYVDAMPRYELGHLARVERIEHRAKTLPGLALAGNAYRGVGIPDAVRSGERAAEALLE
jgi:oxygen-dependent protoporphyrinogen oxidase